MFNKRKKEPECAEKLPVFNKAAEVYAQYKQLSSCYHVLSRLSQKEQNQAFYLYTGGFRLYESDLTNTGIDIEEVYEYMQKLVLKRKLELEIELRKLDL